MHAKARVTEIHCTGNLGRKMTGNTLYINIYFKGKI